MLYSHSVAIRNRYWEGRAREIDSRWGESRGDFQILADIIRRLGVKAVMDFGCGSGRLFPLFEHLGLEKVVGQDVSETALDLGRKKHPNENLVLTSNPPWQLCEKGHQFDLVISNYTLQHIPPDEIEGVVESISRLSPNVYVNEMSETNKTNRFFFLMLHNYRALFGRHGFAVADHGMIENDSWMLLRRGPG